MCLPLPEDNVEEEDYQKKFPQHCTHHGRSWGTCWTKRLHVILGKRRSRTPFPELQLQFALWCLYLRDEWEPRNEQNGTVILYHAFAFILISFVSAVDIELRHLLYWIVNLLYLGFFPGAAIHTGRERDSTTSTRTWIAAAISCMGKALLCTGKGYWRRHSTCEERSSTWKAKEECS